MPTRLCGFISVLFILSCTASFPLPVQDDDPIGKAVTVYFDTRFADLKSVADQDPTVDTFRDIMKPVVERTDGFFGGTLIDPDFVIRQVYYARNFLARGYNLKKVGELKNFYTMMKEHPAPQLSEPGHGNIFQPRLIAMRYPVIKDGRLTAIVSMMVRTEQFLKETGLNTCRAFRITCLGKQAEGKGTLSQNPRSVTLHLPSTEWIIEYDR